MLGLRLNHVSKSGPRSLCELIHLWPNCNVFSFCSTLKYDQQKKPKYMALLFLIYRPTLKSLNKNQRWQQRIFVEFYAQS